MALEDFERSLAESREVEDGDGAEREDRERRKRRKHHHHHRSHPRDGEDEYRHKRSRHSRNGDDEDGAHKRSRNSGGVEERCKEQRKHRHNERRSGENGGKSPVREEEWIEKDGPAAAFTEETKDIGTAETQTKLKRDSWMEAPSALDIDYTQRGAKKVPESTTFRSSKADFELKIHENEINKHHLQNLAEGKDIPDEVLHESAQHEVDYTFGDAGAQWRMTKLKAVYREADESGQSLDDIAIERFGDLRSFDDAREEQIELERRDTYGEGYVGKEKPSGELFQERKLDMGVRRDAVEPEVLNYEDKPLPQGQVMDTLEPSARTVPLDQSALNRLKAQMIKAKLRGAANAVSLEDEYNSALAGSANRIESGVIVLGTMENRMLAGGRKGEVRSIDNKRGRERGLVEENEDMSIEDMVREERRTRGQAGGEGQRFAERIAKDGKFDVSRRTWRLEPFADEIQNDLDYMDENANKLAKRVQKSEINLKNTAISDFQKMNRILDNCPLCHHEDTDTPPVAPVVSLATRVYLTLPTEPEISDGGACIVPIQHRGNLLECDEDEWEEIRVSSTALTPIDI